MNRTFLHIGMPRTASTFFQNEVFPNVRGFSLIGIDQTQYSQPFQQLLYQDESRYDPDRVKSELAEFAKGNVIVSNEILVGQSIFMVSTNRTRNAQRLKELFPEGEVILFLRNQADLLESLYSISVYSGHTAKPEEFIRFDDETSDSGNPLYPTFSPTEQTEQYYYSSLIKIYQGLFGKAHVFLYEDFRENPKGFISAFCEKLNLDLTDEIDFGKSTNSSLSARQLDYLRRTNSLKEIFEKTGTGKKIFRKNVQTIEHRLRGKSKFQFAPALRKKIKDHYREDNQLVTDLLPSIEDSGNWQRHYLTEV